MRQGAERWCGFQQEVADWKSKVIPPSLNTPQGEFTRSLEEVKELHEAILSDDGTRQARQEIGEEATDVIIRMLGIISVVGLSAAELLDTKLDVIKQKYPADIIQGQLEQGVSFELAMATQKRKWEQNTTLYRQMNTGH